MIEVSEGLWVGSDEDVAEAEARRFAICTAAKWGPYGHAPTLGYKGRAPDGPERLWAHRGNRLVLNVVDTHDSHPEAERAYSYGVKWVTERLAEGKNVLVHCNQGRSRAPSIAIAVLQRLGEFEVGNARQRFHKRYPDYDPAGGVATWLDRYSLNLLEEA